MRLKRVWKAVQCNCREYYADEKEDDIESGDADDFPDNRHVYCLSFCGWVVKPILIGLLA